MKSNNGVQCSISGGVDPLWGKVFKIDFCTFFGLEFLFGYDNVLYTPIIVIIGFSFPKLGKGDSYK
jgi:hypothetical protein